MSKQTRALALAGLVVSSPLYAAPLAPERAAAWGFTLSAQTTHFSFYTHDNKKVDAQKSERYLAQVEQVLGQKLAGRAEYYRYGTSQELAAAIGTYALGVTFAGSGQIHSTQEFHAHEIVHLVAEQLGQPGSFFQEGLAVAMGNEGKWNGEDIHKLARNTAKASRVSALIASFDRMDPQTAYPVAGSFVASLIKTHGIDKVARFFRACGISGKDRDAAFAQTFGQTLEEAGQSWAASL